LDVGYGQLHPRLRADPRVTVLERTNVRELECSALPFPPTFVTADVSFISLRKALPPALACAAPGWRALVLVKPQFEAGPAGVRKGRRGARPRRARAGARRDRRAGARVGREARRNRRFGPTRTER